MPFKHLTVRQQIALKREVRQLRQLKRDLESQYSGTPIAEGVICEAAGGAIAAAIKLGHIVVVRGEQRSLGKIFVARAYKLGGV